MSKTDFLKTSKAIYQKNKSAFLENGSARTRDRLEDVVSPERIKPEFRLLVADLRYLLSTYKRILDDEERALASAPYEIRGKLEAQVLKKYGDRIVADINRHAVSMEPLCIDLAPEEHFDHKAYFQEHLLEFVTFSSAFSTRAYQKPRGYAGDYVMMKMLCDDNVYVGRTLFEKCVHRFSVTSPSGSLVKSRLQVIYQELEKCLGAALAKKRQVKVMDLACGPSIPIQRFLKKQENEHVEFTFIDQDPEAIESLKADIFHLKNDGVSSSRYNFHNRSIRELLTDPNSLEQLAGQNLILCSGLFDYLDDETANILTQVLFSLVVPDGTLLIGNICPRLTTKIFQWYVNEWPLTYRDEQELRSLCPENTSCEVLSEPLGFNLFLKIRKADGH